jgi:hypothetical protein
MSNIPVGHVADAGDGLNDVKEEGPQNLKGIFFCHIWRPWKYWTLATWTLLKNHSNSFWLLIDNNVRSDKNLEDEISGDESAFIVAEFICRALPFLKVRVGVVNNNFLVL